MADFRLTPQRAFSRQSQRTLHRAIFDRSNMLPFVNSQGFSILRKSRIELSAVATHPGPIKQTRSGEGAAQLTGRR